MAAAAPLIGSSQKQPFVGLQFGVQQSWGSVISHVAPASMHGTQRLMRVSQRPGEQHREPHA
jgi:hypothetical protein